MAKDIEVLVVFTDQAQAELPSGTTMDDFAADHDIGFDLLTAQDSATEFFTINVIETVEADQAYQEGSDLADVLVDAEDGTIKVGGKTLSEKRLETGADVIAVVSTADTHGPIGAVGLADDDPIDYTNFIFVTDGQPSVSREDGQTLAS